MMLSSRLCFMMIIRHPSLFGSRSAPGTMKTLKDVACRMDWGRSIAQDVAQTSSGRAGRSRRRREGERLRKAAEEIDQTAERSERSFPARGRHACPRFL